MPAKTDSTHTNIAWNNAQITVPALWEPHVAGNRHLIFEKDFQPLLEVRWEKGTKFHSGNFSSVLKKFKKQTSSKIYDGRLNNEWQLFSKKFKSICHTSANGKDMDGGVWFCPASDTLILFQLFPGNSIEKHNIATCINTLFFSRRDQETQWRIQDFTLTTPPSFSLSDYTFAPGLSRLSFNAPHLTTHVCRLAPADTRLSTQSMDKILLALTGIPTLPVKMVEEDNSCETHRRPKIWQQILLRFRREKPFVFARLRHDTEHNRLLAVVLSSRRPIQADIANTIYQCYEIF